MVSIDQQKLVHRKMALDRNGTNKVKFGNNVEVDSVLTVVSSTPVNPAGKTCPLTPLDQAMGQHTLHVIFYYRSGSLEFDSIRPALNEVLTLYPNVTGRLAKDCDGNWEIKCTDAGVRVYRAKVGISVDEWLRSAGADDEMHLAVWDNLPDDPQFSSPFRIQVTDFEGGGSAVALSCPHMLADPVTATSLIESWTDAHRRDVITHPPFIHPLALNNRPKNSVHYSTSAPYYATKSENSEPSVRKSSATFSFSDSVIRRTLSEICSSLPAATPFDLLTALFWTGILRARTQDSPRNISVCVDMRKRLCAPLPYGYFGNAFHFVQVQLDNDQDSMDPSHVAQLVHHQVAGVKEEEFWSAVDWFRSRKDDQGKFATPSRMYGPELTFINLEHMIVPVNMNATESQPLMYMARFDNNEKPVHVSYHVGNADGEGLVFVTPSSDGELARKVSVTLPEQDMRKLLEDPVIQTLNPTLLLTDRG